MKEDLYLHSLDQSFDVLHRTYGNSLFLSHLRGRSGRPFRGRSCWSWTSPASHTSPAPQKTISVLRYRPSVIRFVPVPTYLLYLLYRYRYCLTWFHWSCSTSNDASYLIPTWLAPTIMPMEFALFILVSRHLPICFYLQQLYGTLSFTS